MGKYSYELKVQIVKENLEGFGFKYLGEKYKIPRDTIKNWCIQYSAYGEEGIKKSMSKTKYTGEFKLSVLNYRKVHNLSYRETAEHFGIKNLATISNWQRAYDEEGLDGLFKSIGRPNKSGGSNMTKNTKEKNVESFKTLTESEKEELIRLREENMFLKASLAYEKKLQALIQEKKSQTKKKQK